MNRAFGFTYNRAKQKHKVNLSNTKQNHRRNYDEPLIESEKPINLDLR